MCICIYIYIYIQIYIYRERERDVYGCSNSTEHSKHTKLGRPALPGPNFSKSIFNRFAHSAGPFLVPSDLY